MKYIIKNAGFIMLLCSMFLASTGQNENLQDSIWHKFTMAKHDTVRMRLLIELSISYKYENPDTALYFLHEAYKLAQGSTFYQAQRLKAIALNNLGIMHRMSGNFDKALEYYLEALGINEDLKDQGGLSQSYNNIGIIYHQKGNYKEAIAYFQKTLEIDEQLADTGGMATCYTNIGSIYHYQGNYKEAMRYSHEALQLFKKLNSNHGMAVNYTTIGNIYNFSGSYNLAIENYLEALHLFEEIGNKEGVAGCNNNIGLIHDHLGNQDKAMGYFKKAARLFHELGNLAGLSQCYINIGSIHDALGEYDTAMEYLTKASKISEESGNKNVLSECYISIGHVFKHRKIYDKAMDFYLKSLEIQNELEDKNGISQTKKNIAEFYLELGDSVAQKRSEKNMYYNKAVNYGIQAIELAQNIDALPLENYAASILYKAYKALGNFNEALKYADIYITTRDSLFSEEKNRALTEMETRFGVEKQQLEIDNLNKENSLKDAEIAKSEEQRKAQLAVTYSLVLGFLLLSVFALIIFRLFKQKAKDNLILEEKNSLITRQKAEIEEKNEELLQINEELNSINENLTEKNNIIDNQKTELEALNSTKDKFFSIIAHDLKNPFNTLIGFSDLLVNDFESFETEERKELLKLINDSSKKTFALLENLLTWSLSQRGQIQFSPTEFDINSTINETVQILKEVALNKNIEIEIHPIDEGKVIADASMISTVILNLISNALKFTPREGKVMISTSYHDQNSLQISIRDNGVGISPEHIKKLFRIDQNYTRKGTEKETGTGLGLILCKEFVEKNSGSIWVESKPGEGSTFSFCLPLSR